MQSKEISEMGSDSWLEYPVSYESEQDCGVKARNWEERPV